MEVEVEVHGVIIEHVARAMLWPTMWVSAGWNQITWQSSSACEVSATEGSARKPEQSLRHKRKHSEEESSNLLRELFWALIYSSERSGSEMTGRLSLNSNSKQSL